MYRDGHLVLDIKDESDIKRGLDAYFSDLYDFPSNGHRFRRLKLVAGPRDNSTGNATNQQEMPLEVIIRKEYDKCDRKINAIFEKACSMYHDGHLVLDIEDESYIKRGLDAYFSDLYDFPSNGHRF
ncbi:hypothetical protein Tco_0999347 [Tanacetum coccineum]